MFNLPPTIQANHILVEILFIKIVSLIPAPSKLIDRAQIFNPSSSQVPYPIYRVSIYYPPQVFQLMAYDNERKGSLTVPVPESKPEEFTQTVAFGSLPEHPPNEQDLVSSQYEGVH
ncbi:MAG: hypothetical protein EZS28_005660 [Streblomastix strix]|uniref:Uncharacterized protein n=1 Tax=Streblomastix strix TaxID=222440 RepID=A0A5J4WWC1_9EUKA|nr:MAG: hypothetical protein EZS28_005660 [Streblomastix strix]